MDNKLYGTGVINIITCELIMEMEKEIEVKMDIKKEMEMDIE